MNGDLIIIVLVIAAAVLALLIAKLASFWRGFAEITRSICYNMDHAADDEEYRRRHDELRCHYLCLIPFVNGKNVMRLYHRICHSADKVKKERKDSLVPLLLPSVLGIFICTVCVCSMTWAWFSASVEAPTQKLSAAYYEVTVESVASGESKMEPTDGIYYSLTAGTTYTVTLKASGSVQNCGGYCLIENVGTGEKTYTQTFAPGESITVQFTPKVSGNHTFTGVWGSLPAGTENYLHCIAPDTIPNSDDPILDDANASAPPEPSPAEEGSSQK